MGSQPGKFVLAFINLIFPQGFMWAYCRMLNVRDLGTSDIRGVLIFLSVTSGVLFLYASILFCEFYFGDSTEPHETRLIMLLQKLSILQYVVYTIMIPEDVIVIGGQNEIYQQILGAFTLLHTQSSCLEGVLIVTRQ